MSRSSRSPPRRIELAAGQAKKLGLRSLFLGNGALASVTEAGSVKVKK